MGRSQDGCCEEDRRRDIEEGDDQEHRHEEQDGGEEDVNRVEEEVRGSDPRGTRCRYGDRLEGGLAAGLPSNQPFVGAAVDPRCWASGTARDVADRL